MIITIHETENEEKDEANLNQLVELLKEYRGRDEVHLRIINKERITNLKLTSIFVNFTPDLQKRLSQLIPVDNMIVETPVLNKAPNPPIKEAHRYL